MLEMGLSPVAAVPNLAEVQGRLLHITPEQGGTGTIWEIAVDDTRDVEGFPNFARAYQGKTISAYAHAQLQSDVCERQHFRARVAFRGGPGGGRFVIVAEAVHPITRTPGH